MTPEMERIGKIIVEAEGGKVRRSYRGKKVGPPDFSLWQNFGRMLKVASYLDIRIVIYPTLIHFTHKDIDIPDDGKQMFIDQIPTLVATELARILKEKP